MAEPRIQYAKTSDGVSIAYEAIGEGSPLVQMPGLLTSSGGWLLAEGRRWRERLGEGRLVVRYDHRGFGQSQRDVAGFSLEAWTLDLEAVVDHLRLERFALFGGLYAGPVAIAYAAGHSERVSHLILYGTSARGDSFYESARRGQILEQLADADWELYTELVAHVALGWEAGEAARRYAAGLRENTTPEYLRAAMDAVRSLDVTALLPNVSCPTLVLYRRQVPTPAPEESRLLASRIPGAQLTVLEGDQLPPYFGDTDSVLAAIGRFLGGAAAAPLEAALPSGTAIILFADIADSTALTERLGDAAFREKARELDEALRRAISSNSGKAIEGKLLGDGVLATFGAAREAIACAQACHAAADASGLALHVGIHAGDVIRESNNVYGGAVNIASRVAGESGAGETLVSDIVRGLARTSAGVTFEDRGERELKGVGEPLRLYEVRWRE